MTKKVEKTTRTTRRGFLKVAAGTAAGVFLGGCGPARRRGIFGARFKELSTAERKRLIRRLEKTYRATYGRPITVTAEPARPGVQFAYALDLSRCIGCRRCVYACTLENNQSRHPQIQWIRVLEVDKDKGVDLSHSTAYYSHKTVPKKGHFYVPVACQQCRRPQCVTVCPVGATWKEPDGIVVVDYNWCIGCRYCMSACPYGARHFNWNTPRIPKEEINPVTHYLGNRPRYRGVVEKCTFCIQRVRHGRYPACVEICPVGARKFGDLKDPTSEIRYILENKRVLILKEEINTQPKFFYYYGV
jgi:molybdopterin-containing oxidoreductase family iron-sulfur binding subunit